MTALELKQHRSVVFWAERAMKKHTMGGLSYGIKCPRDLYGKLVHNASKIPEIGIPHPYDVFDFIITTNVLTEWVQTYYESKKSDDPFFHTGSNGGKWVIPAAVEQWIEDKSCLPKAGAPAAHHVDAVLSICDLTANASKHFHWRANGAVKNIGAAPQISNMYQYFFTSLDEGLYFGFGHAHYTMHQVRSIVLQFFRGLLLHLDPDFIDGDRQTESATVRWVLRGSLPWYAWTKVLEAVPPPARSNHPHSSSHAIAVQAANNFNNRHPDEVVRNAARALLDLRKTLCQLLDQGVIKDADAERMFEERRKETLVLAR